jgi:hypothetical protein
VTDIEDSTRWDDLTLRPGDIVISARSKHGTTWIQMICALLIFQDAQLPSPLWQLSPWYDWRHLPAADVRAQLDGQRHRRFIKTHTPGRRASPATGRDLSGGRSAPARRSCAGCIGRSRFSHDPNGPERAG